MPGETGPVNNPANHDPNCTECLGTGLTVEIYTYTVWMECTFCESLGSIRGTTTLYELCVPCNGRGGEWVEGTGKRLIVCSCAPPN